MTIELTKSEPCIKQTIKKFTDAWNTRDARAFARLFAEDADLTNVFDGFNGRPVAEDETLLLFEALFSSGTLVQKETGIRVISQNLASASVKWSIGNEEGKQNNLLQDRFVLMHLILKREQGQWQIYIMYGIDLPAVSAN